MKDKNEELSIFISLILRHKPEVIGIEIDNAGYAKVDELINGINNSGRFITISMLKEIVATDNKKRYSFNEDYSKVRANQGHSIPGINPGLEEKIPPDTLYHGTATRFLDNILSNGIKKQSRNYVQLSTDVETAINVGKRHGDPVVLTIDTGKMHKDGISFFISENGIWQTDFIDPKYIISKKKD
jgi:putative RNA 2'-phosphotransferase